MATHIYRITIANFTDTPGSDRPHQHRPIFQDTPGHTTPFRSIVTNGCHSIDDAIHYAENTAIHPIDPGSERIISVTEIYDPGLLTAITDEQISRMLFGSTDKTNRLDPVTDGPDPDGDNAIVDTTAVDSEENIDTIERLAALFTADPAFPNVDIESTAYPAQVRAEITDPGDGVTYRGVVLDMNRLTALDAPLRRPDAWHVLVRWLLDEISTIM